MEQESNIKWVSSKTGHSVPVVKNITLCSKYNPLKEASDWVESQINSMQGVRSFFVLGVGGGFHLQELVKSFPEKTFFAIDFENELVSLLAKQLKDYKNLIFLRPDSLYTTKSVEEVLCSSSYRVLRYEPSCRLHALLYDSCELSLLGRNQEGIKRILQLKAKKNPYYSHLESLNLTGEENIKDIDCLLKQKKEKQIEDNVWFLLRELVS